MLCIFYLFIHLFSQLFIFVYWFVYNFIYLFFICFFIYLFSQLFIFVIYLFIYLFIFQAYGLETYNWRHLDMKGLRIAFYIFQCLKILLLLFAIYSEHVSDEWDDKITYKLARFGIR